MVSILLIGVNLYAADGNLIVEGCPNNQIMIPRI
jgi:hypothetical protein